MRAHTHTCARVRAHTHTHLSKQKLSETESQTLSLGMNFAIASNEISSDEVITGTDSVARYLCLETAMKLRRLVKATPWTPNHQNPT